MLLQARDALFSHEDATEICSALSQSHRSVANWAIERRTVHTHVFRADARSAMVDCASEKGTDSRAIEDAS